MLTVRAVKGLQTVEGVVTVESQISGYIYFVKVAALCDHTTGWPQASSLEVNIFSALLLIKGNELDINSVYEGFASKNSYFKFSLSCPGAPY